MSRPVDVAFSRSKKELRIEWEDGASSTLPVEYLRAWCPCAGCQGHGTVVEFHEAEAGLGLGGMGETGSYALHFRFSDGHDTGIYTWDWLRRIAPESSPEGYKRGRFVGGRFEG